VTRHRSLLQQRRSIGKRWGTPRVAGGPQPDADRHRRHRPGERSEVGPSQPRRPSHPSGVHDDAAEIAWAAGFSGNGRWSLARIMDTGGASGSAIFVVSEKDQIDFFAVASTLNTRAC